MAAGDFKQATNLNAFLVVGQVASATTETTVHTVPASSQEKIASAVLCNTGTVSATVSVSVVASGGTAGVTNRVVNAFALAAGDSTNVTELVGAMLPAGAFISLNVSAAAAIDYCITGAVSA